jgi:gentisate 1,2-dioxygenase
MGKATLFESERLLVGLNAFEPGQVHELHSHEGMDKLYYVLEGEGVFLLEGRQLTTIAGDLMVAPEGRLHSGHGKQALFLPRWQLPRLSGCSIRKPEEHDAEHDAVDRERREAMRADVAEQPFHRDEGGHRGDHESQCQRAPVLVRRACLRGLLTLFGARG